MEFECLKRGDAMVVAPKGSINTESAPKLEKQLLELQNAAERRLVVDFAQVEYISSAGLRVLLMTARRLKVAGGALALCSMNPGVTKVFALCGFERDFTIVGGRDEAVTRVSGAAARPGASAQVPPTPVPPTPVPPAPAPPTPVATPAAPKVKAVTAPAPVVPPRTAPEPARPISPRPAASAAGPSGPAPRAENAVSSPIPPVVAEALRALATGLAARAAGTASVAPELLARARQVLAFR